MLVAEQALVGLHRTSAREEEARQLARSRMRDLEFAWATFLTRGMEQGAIPQSDPRLLARAVLGLYNSVWHWYRPRGGLLLDEVRDFFVGALPRGRRPARSARQASAGEAAPAKGARSARPPEPLVYAVAGERSRMSFTTSRLTTFRDGVRGKSSNTWTDSGHVYLATPSASRNSCSSASVGTV